MNISTIKNQKTVLTIFLLLTFCFFTTPLYQLKALTTASDKLSVSWPNTPSDHLISFKTTQAIPPGGKILILPQAGQFRLNTEFDYLDLDLATSSSLNGVYSDRFLATSSSAFADGISIAASTSLEALEINLSSGSGIGANTFVRIEAGLNADFGSSSDSQIINPSSIGAYNWDIYTYDDLGVYIERAKIMVAIVEPVTMGGQMPKLISEGTPDGVLNFGTAQTILSVKTNFTATCRWSQVASTSYWLMPEIFEDTGGNYHTSIITGFSSGQTYNYYVRCLDEEGEVNEDDYEISFIIAGFEGEGGDQDVDGDPGDEGSGSGSGGGSGGGGGGGSGALSGDYYPFEPLPDNPIVSFRGWAYPNASINFLKDGVEDQVITAKPDGSFEINVLELPQGVYTFSLWGTDNKGRKSSTQSYTFYVKEGTKTELYDVYLPPTIEIPDPSLDIGDSLSALGQSAANSSLDIWYYPVVVGGVTEDSIYKTQSSVNAQGDWSFSLETTDMTPGPYQLKVRSNLAEAGTSEFSKIMDFVVGGELPVQNTCAGADLNGDGKVNITDFSILLYHWDSDDDCSDQNDDGVVNLIDFSIMMFNWTG